MRHITRIICSLGRPELSYIYINGDAAAAPLSCRAKSLKRIVV